MSSHTMGSGSRRGYWSESDKVGWSESDKVGIDSCVGLSTESLPQTVKTAAGASSRLHPSQVAVSESNAVTRDSDGRARLSQEDSGGPLTRNPCRVNKRHF